MQATGRYAAWLASALAAWGAWLAELFWIKGWTGLAWLSGFNWSSLPASVAILVGSSYFLAPDAGSRGRWRFVGVGVALAMASFVVARVSLFQLFGPTNVPGRLDIPAAAGVLAAGLAPAIGIALLASRWLVPLRGWTGAMVAVALAASIVLAFATVRLFPAVNGSTDDIHAIKMGYPILWCGLLVPLALRLGRAPVATPAGRPV